MEQETVGRAYPSRSVQRRIELPLADEIDRLRAENKALVELNRTLTEGTCEYCHPVPRPWKYYNFCPFCGRRLEAQK